MKRRVISLLLALCLLLSIPAFALDGDALIARQGYDGFDDLIRSLSASGDTITMFSYDRVFYTYNLTDGFISKFEWNSEQQKLRNGIDDDGDRLYRNVVCQFSWRGGLYALAETRYFDAGVVTVELCEVSLKDGVASLLPIREVDWQPLEYDGYVQINACCAVGDTLCFNAYVGGFALCLMPLDGSDMVITDYRNAQFCPFGDELLIAEITRGAEPGTAFSAMNPSTGDVRPLGASYKPSRWPSGFAYDENSDRLLFVDDGSLVSFDIQNSTYEKIAPVPEAPDENANGMCACALDSGVYASLGNSGVALRRVSGRAPAEGSLVIASGYFPEALERALIEYAEANPGIEITRVNADNVLENLLTRSDAVDIYALGSYDYDDIPLAAVLERGWAVELDSDMLDDYVSGMYPSFAREFSYEGELIAVPFEVEAFGLGVNVGALKLLGLSVDDMPTDWAGFFGFINSVSDNGLVPVLGEGGETRFPNGVLRRLFIDYSLEMSYGGFQSFDTDELRDILAAYERLDFQAIAEADAGISYDGNPLISYYESAGVGGSAYADDGYEYYPLRLSISAERPVYMPLQANVAFINPASGNISTAVEFLEFAVRYVDPASLAMMNADYSEPALDRQKYDKYTSEQDAEIEALRVSLETASDGDKHELSEKLESAIDLRRRMEDWYWIVSPESLELYKSRAQNVVLEMPSLVMEQSFRTALSRYIDAADGADALISEIENLTRLMLLENS